MMIFIIDLSPMIIRKKTLTVDIWWVYVGWEHPIIIQSMTNTPTADIDATVEQIKELVLAGSELVRITVDTEASAQAVPKIIEALKIQWIAVPIIGDFHFNGHILLDKYPEMAQSLAKYRINPGNVGTWSTDDKHFKTFIEFAITYNKPVRIGINWWSLDKTLLAYNMEQNSKKPQPLSDREVFIDSMVQSCLISVQKAKEFWLAENMIILSVKLSNVQDVLQASEKLSKQTNCPLHLWLTEAWWSTKWLVSSAAALWILLQQGIGDTIRISVTPEPGQPRALEVEACKYLLQSMDFRYFQPLITSCPGCWRTSSSGFQTLAKQVQDEISQRISIRKQKYPGCETTKIAIMWCVVNGIWESANADIGIFFPGNNENPKIPVYVHGKPYIVLDNDNVFEKFMDIIEKYFRKEI